jgi:hypothetical protein
VGAHGSLGDAEPPGDLAVGVPGRQQARQVVLAGGEPGYGVAAAFGIHVGLVKLRRHPAIAALTNADPASLTNEPPSQAVMPCSGIGSS